MQAGICPEEFDSGLFIGHWGGPKISPYAQAIVDLYDIVVPYYLTVPFHLTGAHLERRYVVAPPYQYDSLLLGAAINGFGTVGSIPDSEQRTFMSVSDNRSKMPWVTPSPIAWAPMTSFGGLDIQPMPILKMPEAYFLPRNVSLVHDIYNLTDEQSTNGTITWVGLQLTNHCNKPAPDCVALANGKTLKIGSRQPLWMPLPMGRESYVAGKTTYTAVAGGNYIQYTEPLDCDAEIHGIVSANLFSFGDTTLDPDAVRIKVTDMGTREMWKPTKAPATAVVGNFTQALPSLPFNKPYILKKGHRLQVSMQNNMPSTGLVNVFLTIRGVKLCEY